MAEEPFNPYAPPQWTSERAGPGGGRRRWWAEGVGRVVAVVLGFSLVADPTALPGINTAAGRAIGGHVFARGVGVGLLGVGFLPWRWKGNQRGVGSDARADQEEL